VVEHLGASNTQTTYNSYVNTLNQRWAVPTDVTLEIGAELTTPPDTWTVSVRVGLEPTGVSKTVRVHIVQVLDYYPAGIRHRNCQMRGRPYEDVVLDPGESQIVTRDVTINGVSADNVEDVRIVAWAQKPGAAWPKEVHQAITMNWPFSPLPGGGPPGDLDGDGDVDLSDLAIFLSAYGSCVVHSGASRADPGIDGSSSEKDLTLLAFELPLLVEADGKL